MALRVYLVESKRHRHVAKRGSIVQLSPRLAKAYARMNPRTWTRDVEILEQRKFLIRDGKTIRANTAHDRSVLTHQSALLKF
jgi:hypothetical protein